MKVAILPYKSTSEGAKFLAQHLDARLIRHINDVRDDEILINWGAGFLSSNSWKRHWLNKPKAIERCVNKITAFDIFERTGVPHPKYTCDQDVAGRWLLSGKIVVARQTASGMMGEGISVLKEAYDIIPRAKFYSQHIQHDDEYRIHVFRGEVINIGKKVEQVARPNRLIRNWGNEWKFTNTDAPTIVQQSGIDAVRALGLDFGAADIGYRFENRKSYVFEVNSAPGSGHKTITRYAQAIQRYKESL